LRLGFSLEILDLDAAPRSQALSRLLDPAQKPRVVFTADLRIALATLQIIWLQLDDHGAGGLCGQCNFHMYRKPGASGERYQGIETEVADTAVQQIV
jgi:hypothetical protein